MSRFPRPPVFASATSPSITDVLAKIGEIRFAVDQFKAKHESRFDQLSGEIQDLNSRFAAGTALSAGRAGDYDMDRARDALVAGVRAMIRGALTTDSNPDGGYTVTPELDKSIQRLIRDESTMRRLARVVTIDRESYMRVTNVGGVVANWVTEKESRPNTAGPKFARVEIAANEMYANPATIQQLIDDSFANFALELEQDLATAFGELENGAFWNGDGVKRPNGVLSYSTAASTPSSPSAWGKIGYTGTGDGSGFVAATGTVNPADCLIDLMYSLRPGYRANATWVMNSATAAIVRKFKDSEGRFIWVDSLATDTPPLLLGYPVAIDEQLPNVAGGNFPIAFGDWQRGYTIVDRSGTRLLLDPYTNKPYVSFYATRRVGGGIGDYNAVKLLKVTA